MSEVVNIRGFDSDKEREEVVFVSNRQLKVIDEGAKSELNKVANEIKGLSDTVLLLGNLINEIDESSIRYKRAHNKCYTSLIQCNQDDKIQGYFYNGSSSSTCYIYMLDHLLLNGDDAIIEYRSIIDKDGFLQVVGTNYNFVNAYNMNLKPTNDEKPQLIVTERGQGNISKEDVEEFISDAVLFKSFLSNSVRTDRFDLKTDIIQLEPNMGLVITATYTGTSPISNIILRWYEDNEENLINGGEEILINPEGEENLIKK